MASTVSRDTSELVDRLTRENTYLRLAQRLAGVGHFTHDRLADRSEWSEALYEILGFPPSLPADFETFLRLVDPVDAQRMRVQVARAPLDDFTADFRFTRADDGRARHGRVTGFVERDATRQPVRIIGILQDITDNKAAEQAARAAERRLEGAARLEAIGALARGLAHDLGNLLTVIVGSAELIEGAVAPGDPLREDTAALVAAADRARHVTGRLLGFARPAPGSGLPLAVADCLRELAPVLEDILGPRVALRFELDAPDATVAIDPGRLEQILVELTRNACAAMPDGGALTVRVARDPVVGDGWLRLDVRDNGVGMPPAIRHRAFEPFFTTRTTPGAHGIGLAACQAIVSGTGGRIEISETSPAGTCVTVRLPIEPTPPLAPRRAGFGAETVLLVDDDTALRATVARGLRQAGYRVLGGTDPLAVYEAVRVGRLPAIDLLISDVDMAGLDGRALVARLRAQRPGLPALLMTGDRTVAAAPDLPVIHKPFTLARLAALVRAILDRAAGADLAEPTGHRPTDVMLPGAR